jgi:hypothetical protein
MQALKHKCIAVNKKLIIASIDIVCRGGLILTQLAGQVADKGCRPTEDL